MKKNIAFVLVLAFILFAGSAMARRDENLAAGETKSLDTFFSNFSEANVESFTRDSLTDQAMLHFALRHHYINNFKSLKRSPDGSSVVVPASMIDQATIKYFDRKIAKHAKQAYTVPLADGEAYVFSQIRHMVDLGNVMYRADGVIFSASSGSTLDPHGTPAEWKKKGEEVDTVGRFTAIVKPLGERWVLVEYTVKPGK